jgi:PadR family transcriptional regulator, regulatory protein AphA
MSSPPLTTTSYAVLGLLAVRPWSSYELTQQMDRSLGRVWPRAVSKLYDEPKKLASHGLARSAIQQTGRRTRTVYTITAQGRRALAEWLGEPGEGPVLEFEQLLKVFFADNGTKADLLATLAAAQAWARARCAESLAIGEQYSLGNGPFPERLPELQLTSRFLTDFYLLVGQLGRHHRGDLARRPTPRQARPQGNRRDHPPRGSGSRTSRRLGRY